MQGDPVSRNIVNDPGCQNGDVVCLDLLLHYSPGETTGNQEVSEQPVARQIT